MAYSWGKNTEFEMLLNGLIGVKHVISMNSCTSALFLALKANNIRGEVILPSFTFVASANSVVTAGAKPVFADIEYSTCNIDTLSIESLIGPNTEALMPVHYGGQCCSMDKIVAIAEKHKLLIIEDSAQTIGSAFNGRQAGSFGIGCFSFFPTKLITTGEGGALTTDSDKIALKVRTLMAHGVPPRENWMGKKHMPWFRAAEDAGYNFRLSNLLAAMGVEQVKKLDKIIRLRRNHAHFLDKHLDKELFDLPVEKENTLHTYQMYTIKIKKGINRDELVRRLNESGIGASVHYDPPVHLQPYYYKKFRQNILEVTELVANKIITLPLYPELRNDELTYIASKANLIARELACLKK